MQVYLHLLYLLPLLFSTSTLAAPRDASKRCVSTISKYDGVKTAISKIGALTVPAGKALDLSGLKTGTKVTVTGDVTFAGPKEWEGPMFVIDGTDITFNGGGHTFDGQGKKYWDGKGGNGGKTKPKMMKVKMSGSFSNLKVLNAPVHTFSIGNKKALKVSGVTVDNSAGDELGSDGKSLGHNSDCFDVSASDVTFDGNTCLNQDDCFAINAGSHITISNNHCSGGHGLSIGSIKSDAIVSDVKITGNTVINSDNGLRIKIQILLIQISNINFGSGNTIGVTSKAKYGVYVLCGSGSCTGKWDWSGLKVTGGKNSISGKPPITGFTA
ncbi:uncharacterized protein L201_003005 [Kwoniella dendrophila CBS 6074]|uniref:endo-polygalacturonase n=1 Tax=Kwoniella dendrophila CBS 6074 TaxID=1295534 RepID=A0AAX4JSH0_9TREE